MMSKDVCPTCGIPWPKFCPKDGTKLSPAGVCPNDKSGASAASVGASVASVAPSKASPDKELDKVTRHEMEPVKRPGLGSGALDALTKDKKVEVPAAVAPGGKKKRKRSGFSETQWFMRGVDTNQNLEEGPKEEEYSFDENISEEKRKAFTLRRKDEE
jgi:hypothetical protein